MPSIASIGRRVRDWLEAHGFARREAAVALPRVLGPYHVAGLVGSGGSGTVYRCYDVHRGRVVAVKRLHPALRSSPGARRRFLHEGRVAKAIRDDHVVATHAVLAREDPPLLVMEYLAGGSLEDHIAATGPLPVEEVVHVGMDVARGLDAIHARGLVHTDLKPANVLVDDTHGRLAIGDLGLARVLEAHGRSTRAAPAVGTPSYVSPEQAQSFPLGPASDLYSLGAVLYATCTGTPPFPGDSTVAVLRDLLGREPPPLRERREDVPGWLAALIHELLSKTPAFRPRSARAVLAGLEEHGLRCDPRSCAFRRRATPIGRARSGADCG